MPIRVIFVLVILLSCFGSCYKIGYKHRKDTEQCIPVLGVTVIADPQFFLFRLIKSIDYCINQLIVVYGRGFNITSSFPVQAANSYIRKHILYRYSNFFFGVAEGWNQILRLAPRAAYYLICGYDVEFPRGDLGRIATTFTKEIYEPVETDHNVTKYEILPVIGFMNWTNMHPGGYAAFLISIEVINKLGFFDENYFPVCN